MTKYVLKRLLYMVIVFLLVSLLMYSIYNLIPTDPARAQLEPMKTTLKPDEYEQRYQLLRQQMADGGFALTQTEAAMCGRYTWLDDPWPWDAETEA